METKECFLADPAPRRPRCVGIVPNVVVEVLSDSTAHRDRTEKAQIYAENGVDETRWSTRGDAS